MEIVDNIIRACNDFVYFRKIKRYPVNVPVDTLMQAVIKMGKLRTDRFVIDSENRFAYENIIRWCIGDSDMQCLDPITKEPTKGSLEKGIYIAGNTGSGKSWCMEIVSSLVSIMGIGISYDGDDDKQRLRLNVVRADDIVSDFLRNGNIESYKKSPILTIQDFGQEQLESVYMGNHTNVLKNLIEYRGDIANRMTLFTSNYPISNDILTEMYGARVTSRLIGMCNYFEIKGKDRRK